MKESLSTCAQSIEDFKLHQMSWKVFVIFKSEYDFAAQFVRMFVLYISNGKKKVGSTVCVWPS